MLLAYLKLDSTRITRSFSAKPLSSWSAPSLYWCLVLFLYRCRTLHFPLLNFMRFPSVHLSSLSRFLRMAAWPSGISGTPHSFVSSADLLKVHSVPSSRSSMKMLNGTGPSINPWGNTTSDWCPAGLCSVEKNLLSAAVQLLVSPTHCPFI